MSVIRAHTGRWPSLAGESAPKLAQYHVRALAAFTYHGRRYRPGDTFEADEQTIRTLFQLGYVTIVS